MDRVWKQRFELHTYEVGPRGEARLDALMGFLQEAAGAQSASWKVAVPDLLPLGRTWVLARHHLKIARYPRLGERLEVRTWPAGFDRLFAVRDFELCLPDGEPVATATTTWALLDLEQKRPLPADGLLKAEHQLERRVIEDRFEPLPGLGRCEREARFRVMHRDLDLNGHVNHAVYPQWAREAVPEEIARGWRPVAVETAYRAEALAGDEILSQLEPLAGGPGEQSFAHRIAHARSGAELTRLRTVWRPR